MAQLNSPTNHQGTNYENECFAKVSVLLPVFPLVQFLGELRDILQVVLPFGHASFSSGIRMVLFRLYQLSVFDII